MCGTLFLYSRGQHDNQHSDLWAKEWSKQYIQSKRVSGAMTPQHDTFIVRASFIIYFIIHLLPSRNRSYQGSSEPMVETISNSELFFIF